MSKGFIGFRFIEQEDEIKLVRYKFDKRGSHRHRTVFKIPIEEWGKLKEAFFDYYKLRVQTGVGNK